MPDPKDNQKGTGDVHPPEVEEREGKPAARPHMEGAQGTPPDGSVSRDVENAGRSGKPTEQAGYGKDKDAPGMGNKNGQQQA